MDILFVNFYAFSNNLMLPDPTIQSTRKVSLVHAFFRQLTASPYPTTLHPTTRSRRSYLLRCDGQIAERPQQMLMRVSVGIHKEDVDAAIQTYHMMSRKLFTHATPTLFNSGTPRPQMSSCFLLTMKEDSIEVHFLYKSVCNTKGTCVA